MHSFISNFFMTTLLLCIFTFPVHAEEQPLNPIEVRGLVVSTRDGLTINDGVRDYLLLGVDNIGIEGRVCVIFGNLTQEVGGPTIDVFKVHLVSEEYPQDDNIGIRKDWHILTRTALGPVGHIRQAFPRSLMYRGCAMLTSERGKNDVPLTSRWALNIWHIVPIINPAKLA